MAMMASYRPIPQSQPKIPLRLMESNMYTKLLSLFRIAFCMSFLVIAARMTEASQLIKDDQVFAIAAKQFERIKSTVPQAQGTSFAKRATCVAEALIGSASDVPAGVKWEIRVFEDKTPNVFSMAGGQIGINSGIQVVATNNDELAAAIATPVAEVLLKHAQQQMSRRMIVQLRNAITSQLGLPTSKDADELMEVVQVRKEKEAADKSGRELMQKAGFDSAASISLLEKLMVNLPQAKSELEPRLNAAKADIGSDSSAMPTASHFLKCSDEK